jgi:hypothetical protein
MLSGIILCVKKKWNNREQLIEGEDGEIYSGQSISYGFKGLSLLDPHLGVTII